MSEPIRAKLELPARDLRRWRKVMNSKSPRDFADFGYRGTVIFCMSAPFGDGVEADLRVVTSISEGENPWCEVIFFKRSGRQMIESAVTDVSDDLEGDWPATIDGKDYVLSVVKQGAAQRMARKLNPDDLALTVEQIRTLCLKGKMTQKSLADRGYTKVYGLKIPLELMTDQELEEGRADIRHCAEEAAFFDNAKKSDLLYESERQIKGEIARRKGVQHEKEA